MRLAYGLGFVVLTSACGTARPAAHAPLPAPASSAPALVVLVVVDQLPVRLYDRVKPWFEGGMARFTGDGAFQAVGHYAYARTLTCPGHATLSTGAAPSTSGIPANAWSADGQMVYCADASFLRAEPLADVVHARGGKVASLSIKDRAAVMMGGHAADAIVWMDLKALRFTGGADPSSVATIAALDAAVPLAPYAARPWEALRPDLYAGVFPDAQPFELGPGGMGQTFPHPAPTGTAADGTPVVTAQAFRAQPSSGDALADAAAATVGLLHLGQDATPDLLAVSFSDTDYIGHAFTPDSWEAMDGLLRLDQSLGRLFASLDDKVGAGRWSVLLTSDHGCAGGTGTRIRPGDVEARANAAIAAAGFEGKVELEDGAVFLPPSAKVDDAARRKAEAAVIAAVSSLPGVVGAYAWGRPDGVPDDAPNAEAIRLSHAPGRSGDVLVVPAEGAMFDSPEHDGTGTGHGTPYGYDTRVPVVAWGAGVRAGAAGADLDTRRVAPTLAALLGVPAPVQATLPPIAEALAVP
jgi:hypothetical protein